VAVVVGAAPVVGLIPPPIPDRGLDEVLRSWSGPGQLWEALAAAEPEELAERRWSARDVRRRAHRILLQELTPHLARWPTDVQTWLDALPAESHQVRTETPWPGAGVSWTDTRRRGWPPTVFVGRTRVRTAAMLLVTTLSWVLERLDLIRTDAVAVESEVDHLVRRQLDVALGLRGVDPVDAAQAIRPSAADARALASEGRPWTAVAAVARHLIELDAGGVTELARRLVMPVSELRPRLFHLAVLGELLHQVKARGWTSVSVRPLSGASGGPAYRVERPSAAPLDLWFEAAGAWGHYKKPSPYLAATAGVAAQNRPLGADLMLLRPGHAALLVECKYSPNSEVVARGGYEQVLAYAVEALTELAPQVVSVVVGPGSVVRTPHHATTAAGRVWVASPDGVGDVLDAFAALP
jgi:hypothetical protein